MRASGEAGREQRGGVANEEVINPPATLLAPRPQGPSQARAGEGATCLQSRQDEMVESWIHLDSKFFESL